MYEFPSHARLPFSMGRDARLRLPGYGFSIWTGGPKIPPPPAADSERRQALWRRGFSIPEPELDPSSSSSPSPASPASPERRGFVKKKVRRIVSGAPAPESAHAEPPVPIPQPVPLSAPEALPPTTFAPPPALPTISPPNSPAMTAPSPSNLPGSGFSIWTEKPPTPHAIQLVSSGRDKEAPPPPICSPEAPVEDSTRPVKSPRRGRFLQWAAVILFLSALAAYLATESKRRELFAAKKQLEGEKVELIKEKQGLHDNWKEEESLRKLREATIAEKEAAIGSLERDLNASKARVIQLTAEKNGLNETIKDLRGSLAMAIEDHKNTEASLRRVIGGLEQKNEALTADLTAERVKLNDVEKQLSQVMSELLAATEANQQLGAENEQLKNKVAELQTSVQQTLEEARAKETELRREITQLQESNQELQSALDLQRAELVSVREELRLVEEKVVAEEDSRVQIELLGSQLAEVNQIRDQLEEDKATLAQSVVDLQRELESLLEKPASGDLETLAASEKAKEELLERNVQLQTMVEQLTADLAQAAEASQSRESDLAAQIEVLTQDNAQLKASLDKQREEFDAILKHAGNAEPAPAGEAEIEGQTAPGPATSEVNPQSHEELKEAVKTLTKTLDASLQSQREAKDFSESIAEQTEEILRLNTRLAHANQELSQAQGVLDEVEALRKEVQALRQQGETLQLELSQRAMRIHTLGEHNATRVAEVAELRQILQAEQQAQRALKTMVESLQHKLAEIQSHDNPSGLASAEHP